MTCASPPKKNSITRNSMGCIYRQSADHVITGGHWAQGVTRFPPFLRYTVLAGARRNGIILSDLAKTQEKSYLCRDEQKISICNCCHNMGHPRSNYHRQRDWGLHEHAHFKALVAATHYSGCPAGLLLHVSKNRGQIHCQNSRITGEDFFLAIFPPAGLDSHFYSGLGPMLLWSACRFAYKFSLKKAH